jgi:hypothetical protein
MHTTPRRAHLFHFASQARRQCRCCRCTHGVCCSLSLLQAACRLVVWMPHRTHTFLRCGGGCAQLLRLHTRLRAAPLTTGPVRAQSSWWCHRHIINDVAHQGDAHTRAALSSTTPRSRGDQHEACAFCWARGGANSCCVFHVTIWTVCSLAHSTPRRPQHVVQLTAVVPRRKHAAGVRALPHPTVPPHHMHPACPSRRAQAPRLSRQLTASAAAPRTWCTCIERWTARALQHASAARSTPRARACECVNLTAA